MPAISAEKHGFIRHFDSTMCVFRANLDTDSAANWTVIPPQTGHASHGKLDT
jgi:hypothetical protein